MNLLLTETPYAANLIFSGYVGRCELAVTKTFKRSSAILFAVANEEATKNYPLTVCLNILVDIGDKSFVRNTPLKRNKIDANDLLLIPEQIVSLGLICSLNFRPYQELSLDIFAL